MMEIRGVDTRRGSPHPPNPSHPTHPPSISAQMEEMSNRGFGVSECVKDAKSKRTKQARLTVQGVSRTNSSRHFFCIWSICTEKTEGSHRGRNRLQK
jgi:hypothetical protein